MMSRFKTKRVLALLLAAIMAFSTPLIALADETSIPNVEAEITTEEYASSSEEEIVEEKTSSPSDADEGDEVEVAEATQSEIVLEAAAEDGMKVTIRADADAFEYSEDLSLDVSVVPEEVAEEADKELESETKDDNIAKRVTYDIKVMHDGTEIEPVDGKKVQVEFTMAEIPSGADAVSVYHHNEETEKLETIVDDAHVNNDDASLDTATAREVVLQESNDSVIVTQSTQTTEVDEEGLLIDGDIIDDVTVKGKTQSFSLYTVDFTYEEKIVSIVGDTTHNKLADVLANLNITEEIEDAKAYEDVECKVLATDGIVKDAAGKALFSVYREDGIWYVDAVNVFSSEHGLIINTADGSQYRIKVTDEDVIDAGNFLTFTALKDGSSVTFNWTTGSDVMYSKDGADWQNYTINTTIGLSKDQTVSFKGSNVNTDYTHHFSMTGSIAASGDVTSLTNGTGGDVALTGEMCYLYMFLECTSLTTAPSLPSTTLTHGCYENMFQGCTNLITAPSLPATTLQDACYMSMFYECSSLTAAPSLPATTLAGSCYASMFQECNNLTTVPSLPATTLASGCYCSMFQGCEKLLVGEKSIHKPYVGKEIFTCPIIPPQAELVKNMFLGTRGAFTDGTPRNNETYYTYSSNISLDKNGVDATAGTVTKVYATNDMTMPTLTLEQLPTNPGYTFVGYFDATASGVQYYNADGSSTKNWDRTDVSVTLYAHWAIDINAPSITVNQISSETYISNAITPTPEVKDGANTLIKGTHYTLSYSNNTNAGTATVTITGIGKYTGQRNEEFEILPAPLFVNGTSVPASREYNGNTTATCVMGTVDGILGSDDVQVTIESADYEDKNAGIGKSVYIIYKLTGNDSGNYSRPEDLQTVADITPKHINVVADNKSSYVGYDLMALTYTADALCGTDTYTGELVTDADKNTVGVYNITRGNLNAGSNYTINFTQGSYTVNATPTPETNTESSSGSAWTSVPSAIGSETKPIDNGSWKEVNGTFKYVINGEPLKNALAWISYTCSDGKKYAGKFYFNRNGIMQVGWQLIDNIWYYFEPTAGHTQGIMKVTCWVEIEGKFYYLGEDGKMLVNTTTPDGKKVGADGAMIQ